MYNIKEGDKKTQEKTINRFKFWNKWFVVPLYRAYILPLFGFGRIFLLIYHSGRKTGKRYITPVEYRKKDGQFLIFASRGPRTDWYQNIKHNPDKTILKIGFRKHKPEFEFIEDTEEKTEIMKWYCESYPRAASYLMGWDKKIDEANDETLGPLSEFISIIRFAIS